MEVSIIMGHTFLKNEENKKRKMRRLCMVITVRVFEEK